MGCLQPPLFGNDVTPQLKLCAPIGERVHMSPPNKSGAWSWWRAETDPGMIIFVSLDAPTHSAGINRSHRERDLLSRSLPTHLAHRWLVAVHVMQLFSVILRGFT